MILVEAGDNGYLVYERSLDGTDWHRPVVIEEEGDGVDAQVRVLWAVADLMGWLDDSRAEWVVSISKEHGRKWVSPEEWATVVRG